MKVGGNESATKYFQTHGGSAALASKDPKTKYTSNAANKYKDELARRVQQDVKKNPDDINLDEIADDSSGTGTSTPAGEPADDFFSSWDKPAIKRPSNPPSRTGTPAQRTGSPFLNPANGNGSARPKSPLVNADSTDAAAAPATSRAIPSAAIRKTPATSKPKANILGAKKSKLGAKKIDSSALDFDAAEKKAKEEAERKERLGYDPDAEAEEAPAASTSKAAAPATITDIQQPTPVSPAARNRRDSDVERLGMGVRRLGFGQVGGGAPAAAKPAARGMGFGAVRKPVEGMHPPASPNLEKHQLTRTDDSEKYARTKFGAQKGISSDEFFGKGNFDPTAQSEAKTRLQGFEGAQAISSNAYFGRPEDEGGEAGPQDLEGAARDFVRQFGITAGDDLENLSALVGEGATKLQGAIRNYLNG